ncbi:retinol dehydrogenase 14-like [Choristoneura fumiferana]|uniref:retinol dehydrogenase 14-like n=1 Tax=Choristoneura fumiferana TaxID=7141 RepID=UPI003D15E0D6
MFIILSLLISLAITGAWAYNKITTATCKTSRHLVGKVVIVTGGNAGIGYETAKDLAERGARVLLACRDEGRGAGARDKLIEATGNRDVHYRHLDLASLASVRAFADNILKTEQRLDILINNAGVCGSPYIITEDGLLFEMQINHFGPFLLTNLLLPLLKSSAPSRIINVSSSLHKHGEIDFNNLNKEKDAKKSASLSSYSNSKLCNVLMAAELARRLEGTGVTVNSLDPGAVHTDILHSVPLIKILMTPMMLLFYKTPWEGAQTTIYCAVAPELSTTSGRYFSDCRERKPSQFGQDVNLARKLWDISEKLVKL